MSQASYEAAWEEADDQIAHMPGRLEDFSVEQLEEGKYACVALASVLEAELRERYASQNPMDTA